MERWSGKVALVTGASAGIGATITEELAKAGLIVFGLARRAEKIEELKKNVGKVKGEIIPLKGDVSKESDILAAFKVIKEKLGTIHVLVNNAGIARWALLSEGDPKLFREVIDVNVMGLTICTQEALKLMKESGVNDGHIIHINSIAGHKIPTIPGNPNPNFNIYPASKHAVTALTESLRQELNFLKTKIRVTSISPGHVETDIIEASVVASGACPEEEFLKLVKEFPSLKSKDIADAVLYVLSTPAHVQVHELTIKPVGEMF